MMIDVSQVKSFVAANLNYVSKAQQVATQLNCSLDKLKKTFYRSEKLSLSRFIRDSRVSRMKERLQASHIPCKVICLDLGLREDVGARLFKNSTGMTMQEFRKLGRRDTSELWKAEARKQAENRTGPRLVLTENVIRQVLSTTQDKLCKQVARRSNGVSIQGPAH
jgi:AraC-like DNA-binding protein